jgi:sterol desaturase/sphingolipid hydroxylase (fatty acid hydroxylase superfamily)
VLALDLAAYLGHRWRHHSARLWRIHRAHHTDPDMDVTTSLRNHPLDVAFIGVVSTTAAVALGASAMAVAVSGALSATWGVWAHARVCLPRRLEVLHTPGTHRVHHAPERPLTDSNFGLVLTVWDRLFGTFAAPNPSQVTGLDTADLNRRQGFRAMLADPWRPTVPLPDRDAGQLSGPTMARVSP